MAEHKETGQENLDTGIPVSREQYYLNGAALIDLLMPDLFTDDMKAKIAALAEIGRKPVATK